MVNNDDALIELVAKLIRLAGETRDERIADIALYSKELLQKQEGIFDKMLLQVEQKDQDPTPYNPFGFSPPVNRRTS